MSDRKRREVFTREEREELSGAYKNSDNRIPENFDLDDAGIRNEFAERQAKRKK